MDTLKIDLIGSRNIKVPAVIRPLYLLNDTLMWYTQWFPEMFTISGEGIYPDSHWDVSKIFEFFERQVGFKILILEARNQIQGYMILNLNYIGQWQKVCIYSLHSISPLE